MAIVLEATTSKATVNGGSGVGNFFIDVPSCVADEYVVFWRTWNTSGGGTVSGTPTMQGSNMTLIANRQVNNRRVTCHILKVTSAGTNTCAFTDTGDPATNSFVLIGQRFSGVDLTTPVPTAATVGGHDGDSTTTDLGPISSATGRLVVGGMGTNGRVGASITQRGGATSDGNIDDTNATGGASTCSLCVNHIDGAASVTPGWGGHGFTQTSALAFELAPAGAAGGQPSIRRFGITEIGRESVSYNPASNRRGGFVMHNGIYRRVA
jgi:hypothetical protein